MVAMGIVLLISLLIAGAVVLYVAYPRRGERVPHAPWLGEALHRGVVSLPTIDNTSGRDTVRR